MGLIAHFARWGKFAVIRLVQMVSLEFEYGQTWLYRTWDTTNPLYIEDFFFSLQLDLP